MTLNYCTLFDSNYLSRALAMYESLSKHAEDFHLYVFAFDDVTLRILNAIELPHTTVISLEEFEDSELLKIKFTRSQTEYCWTCTPSILLYAIKNYDLAHCTYIDADLYFYHDPKVLFEEMGGSSIMLSDHNYASQYDQTATSGKYCVQFMTFRNDAVGIASLEWWRKACNEWCYERVEDGKFGDQKYLDDWTERFERVHVLKNRGAGVAPWNAEKFELSYKEISTDSSQTKNKPNKTFFITEKDTHSKWQLIFYHFHSVKMIEEIYSLFDVPLYRNQKIKISDKKYNVPKEFRELIYTPYLLHLYRVGLLLRFFGSRKNGLNFHATVKRHRKIENRLIKLVTQ